MVIETEMSFAPGPYELVLVAHETTSDQVISAQVDGDWPNPNAAPATIVPIAVLQPANAAFVRAGEVRTQGALGVDEKHFVVTSLPTAMVSLICRSKGRKGNLVVQRRLIGDSSASFDDIELDFGEERCAQVRDVIPGGTMTAGSFEYEVVVKRKDEELATGSRVFFASGDSADQLAQNEAGS